MTREKLRKT